MTPAITVVKQKKISYQVHEYEHDSSIDSYGLEAAEKLSLSCEKVFKTLIVIDDKKNLAVAILPVDQLLSLKKMAKALEVKKTNMADPSDVERSTGYILGGISPLGQKKRLRSVIDQSALTQETIYISAGKRGLEIELAPESLAKMILAKFVDITQNL